MKQIIFNKPLIFLSFTLLIAQVVFTQETKPEIPKGKQTSPALYLTSSEAYHKWSEDTNKVKILDVRTQEEYLFVGHAEMAWNIPLFLQNYIWDSEKGHLPMTPNPDFLEKIREVFTKDDIILVTCRSGGRSAMAVNKLAEAGYSNVYNILDGFEGDKVKDINSVFFGERKVNGWKNSGLPYTYKINPELMLIPTEK